MVDVSLMVNKTESLVQISLLVKGLGITGIGFLSTKKVSYLKHPLLGLRILTRIIPESVITGFNAVEKIVSFLYQVYTLPVALLAVFKVNVPLG